MKWEQIPLGPIQTNCYLLYNKNNECLIFDPGEEGKKLIQFITSKNLQLQAILLTHAHYDHIGAVDEVRDHFQVPVYIHEKEAKWLFDPSLNGSQLFPMGEPVRIKPADVTLAVEGEMTVGSFTFNLYETPGHSPGSVSYYFKENDLVISGDVLFQGSIGRTDLTGGNFDQLMKSIETKLLTLPEETIVLPGHGPATTIAREMDSNPFLNGF